MADFYDSKEIKEKYTKSQIAYMRKRDLAGYQTMTESERWSYDKRHRMLDF